jgi:hypothetical protein
LPSESAIPVPPPRGNPDLAQLAALLAGSVPAQFTAPPQVQEVGESSAPQIKAFEPLLDLERPTAAAPEKISDPLPTVGEKVEAAPPPAASRATVPIPQPPAPIPIRPITRSNAAAGKKEASAGADAPNTETRPPPGSAIPPPRPPQAKPRLRPRPNLQPRFESHLQTVTSADDGPAHSAPSVSAAPENPESVTYLDYLAPDFSTRHEDFQAANAAAEEWPEIRERQRTKFFWFVGCEVVVLALLVGAVLFGWSNRFGYGSLSPAARLGAVVGAIVAAVLPIIFYGLPQTLPRDRR